MNISPKWYYFSSGMNVVIALGCAASRDLKPTLINGCLAGLLWIVAEHKEAGRE